MKKKIIKYLLMLLPFGVIIGMICSLYYHYNYGKGKKTYHNLEIKKTVVKPKN